MYSGDPLALAALPVRDLSGAEKNALASYLEIPLNDGDKAVFSTYLEGALEKWRDNRDDVIDSNRYLRSLFSVRGLSPDVAGTGPDDNAPAGAGGEYMDRIVAILVSFADYQYNVSDNDDASIAALIDFLRATKDGDCVEFSNTAALLGRLAGIPSRVVTGYLAAGSLQTRAHLRGLAALRSQIKVLQDFPFENLYLVTDAHSHAWTQFYVPDYGWLDFEATTFAIPPIGMGDGNLRDVVIPLLDDTRVFSQVRAFPWRAVLRVLALLVAAALLGAYTARYGREVWLRLGAQRGGRLGARSLYLLLLARLAADGKPIKPASTTAAEYARLFPGAGDDSPFKPFADLYTELRWRQFADPAEQDARFQCLTREYRTIIKALRRRGVPAFFIRIFSLRGLAYL
jgi:hypothetical protein